MVGGSICKKSNYINDSNINSLINQFPRYKIVEIQNAGHWVHAENLNDFIKKLYFFWNLKSWSPLRKELLLRPNFVKYEGFKKRY